MNAITDILQNLKNSDVKLSLSSEGNLRIENKKGALTPELLEQIKVHKAALIQFVKRHSQGHSVIAAVEPADHYPLSSAQWRMWLASMIDESANANVISRAIQLEGKVDPEALQQSLLALVERHEILRMVFKEDEDGEVHQYVLETSQLDFNISQMDFSATPDADRRVKAWIDGDIKAPFHLRRGPLLRMALLKMSEKTHVFVITMHHIISDGWSVEILVGELMAHYNALLEGTNWTPAPLNIQYKDYAAWQRREQETEAMQAHRDFWLEQFSGELPTLELPGDFPRPPLQSYNGAQVRQVIPAELVRDFRNLCKAQGATLFMGLLAVKNILLYRYTGQQDLVIGSPVAGREHPELENQIGFYINTIALRNRIEKGEPFISFLQKVKARTLRVFEHQSFPFDRLVEEVKWPRDASRHPLFDVMLILQGQTALQQMTFNDANIEEYPIQKKSSQFDLTFEFREAGDVLELTVDYNTDIYESWRIERMMAHFQQLLLSAVETPQQTLEKLPLLSAQEATEILINFNNTTVDYPKDKTLVTLFTEQVKRQPEQTAVFFNDRQMSFQQLDDWSDRFANFLQKKHGITSGDLVGLKLEKSEWMVVTILGILKAGAAYVPIDVANPEDRIQYMLENSNSKVLIDEEQVLAFQNDSATYTTPVALEKTSKDGLLAVIYTSGSTNQPKGVSIYTSNMLNRLYWMWQQYPFETGEVASVKTSIGFVDHLWELFGPLLQGVPMVVFDKNTLLDIDLFIDKLSTHQVSRIVLVPTLLREILADKEACQTKLQALKYWTCSGEVLSAELVQDFYRTFDHHKLFNIYGSTEVTADATLYDFSEKIEKEKQAPSLKLFSYQEEQPLYEILDHSYVNGTFPGRKKNQTPVLEALKEVSLTKAQSFAEYKEFLQNELAPNVVNVSSTRFIGHMTGPVPPIVTDLHNCVNLLNQNLVKLETSGMGTQIERQVLGCFHHLVYQNEEAFYEEFVQNPAYSLGNITSGGTISNITALSYALSHQLKGNEAEKGINKIGLVESLKNHQYERVVIIGSKFCHYSMNKALKILGLGTDAFIPFDFDPQNLEAGKQALQDIIDQLKAQRVLVLAIVGVAGTTEAGKIDPLMELGEVAQHNGIHYHVDGAFGGAFIFSEKLAPKLRGIELADTVTLCGHKQLYLPVGISLCIFKAPDFVKSSEINTRYQARKGSIDLGKYTIEGSRPFSALILHGALHIVGKEGYGEMLESNYDRAQLFSQLIAAREAFDLYEVPHLNILLYRYIPEIFREKLRKNTLSQKEVLQINELNRQIQKEQFKRGHSFVSYTELLEDKNDEHGIVWFRSVLMNPYTTTQHLEEILEEQLQIAGDLEGRIDEFQKVSTTPRKIPIGKPINNVQVYILDETFNVLPIGVAGEICIGGEGVAKGYLNNEALTDEKFVVNPFRKGERMYRTGDIGRWLPDSNIEFVSRKDDQVKIRGYRIELGEIDTVLKQSAMVSQGVTLARKDALGNQQLVAYVVPAEGYDTAKLREELKRYLPGFMVPSLLVELEEMPLTASGKIDKKSLPDQETVAWNKSDFVAPQSDREIQLTKIWQELLGLDQVGIHDNFFALGGHSLTVTRLVNKMRKDLQLNVKITDVFLNPTIHELSRLKSSLSYTPIPKAEAAENYPMTPAQRGVWVLSQFSGGSRAYNIPAIFYLEGMLDREALQKAFDQLIDKHEILRTVFLEDEALDDDIRQYVLPKMEWTIDYVKKDSTDGSLEQLINVALDHDFDLEEGPLLKATLIQTEAKRHLMVLMLHHIISDGFSFAIIARDLLAFYRAEVAGRPVSEKQLSIQYGDYALWQEAQLEASAMQLQKDYWLKQLSGKLPKLDIVHQRRPQPKTFNGALFNKVIAPALAEKLENYASSRNGTLFMGLLSVLNMLLHRYSRQEDILIGSPVAARNQEDLEGQVGFYVNTLVFRTRFGSKDTFAQLFEKVKKVSMEALDHQAYPFDDLVADLRPPKDSSRNALFDMALVLQKTDALPKSIEGDLQVQAYEGKYQVNSKFDMTFDFVSQKDGLHLSLEYNSDLYSRPFIKEFYRNFENLLQEVMQNEELTLNQKYFHEALVLTT